MVTTESRFEPELTEFRYSTSFGGWFWAVRARNPAPHFMGDGTAIDSELFESGFASRRRSAERAVRRAKRKMVKAVERTFRETGKKAAW